MSLDCIVIRIVFSAQHVCIKVSRRRGIVVGLMCLRCKICQAKHCRLRVAELRGRVAMTLPVL